MAAIIHRKSPRPSLLVFEISAKIAKTDIEMMAEAVDKAFDQYAKIDLLLIMTDFEGMDPDAALDREALTVQARSITHVRKYAVVGAVGWARAMIEISGVVSPVATKTFDLTDEAQAWEWVDAES